MRILLDTNALLFAISTPERLSPGWQDLLYDTTNQIFVSSVSAAEIAIKSSIGKLPDGIVMTETVLQSYGFTPLAFLIAHGNALRTLPLHHRDPFDRMLIVQAMVEDLTIMTTDHMFAAYEVPLVPAQPSQDEEPNSDDVDAGGKSS